MRLAHRRELEARKGVEEEKEHSRSSISNPSSKKEKSKVSV